MGVFTMPSLGADMEAGKLVEWLVKPGDAVTRGQVVAVVETQKGAIEVECFQEGRVAQLEALLGQTLPVGAPLAVILAPGETTAPEAPAAPAKPVPATEPTPPAVAVAPPPPPSKPVAPPPSPASRPAQAGAGPAASPAARARAAELGLDLSTIKGTGPGGAVLLADVEAAATALPAPEAAPPRRGKPGLDIPAMRHAIAAAMARSKREIPHYYLAQTIDLQPAAGWLARTNAVRAPDARLLMSTLFLRVTALAARKVPGMNGHFVDGAFRPSEGVHVAPAISLRGGGLVTPAIRNTDMLGLDALMATLRDLVERARVGRLRSSEMTDGTITMTSMGETGADMITGVIYPPQVAIVGFGAPTRRPWVEDEAVVPRLTVVLTLAADHRVSDGRLGARFLAEIARLLQNPEGL
jgi:pyruvate dehydrogenase E2 component (dihydrolipoamide acetyltransferase)